VKINDDHSLLIWAHRGRNRHAPENTMAAFRAAFEAGDTGVELDVTLSSDGRIIVIHDDSVDRTTNGNGLVSEMTFVELRQLDAGSWFGSRFSEEQLPRPSDILSEARGQALVNIEIKHSSWRNIPEDGIEILVLDSIRKTKMKDSVLISGFDWRSLKRIRSIDKEVSIAVLAGRGWDPGKVAAVAAELDAYSIHPDAADVIDKMPASYLEFNGRIFPYTVDNPISAAKILQAGADGYFADLPFESPDQGRA
jgi:glycerophosphoryl diester phosphodiesterase